MNAAHPASALRNSDMIASRFARPASARRLFEHQADADDADAVVDADDGGGVGDKGGCLPQHLLEGVAVAQGPVRILGVNETVVPDMAPFSRLADEAEDLLHVP